MQVAALVRRTGSRAEEAPATAKNRPRRRRAIPPRVHRRKARWRVPERSARAEQARLRVLQTAMTPRFKTVRLARWCDVRAAASISCIPARAQSSVSGEPQDERSIASITKVMTAVVFLEDQPDLSQVVTVERGDTYAASTTYLRANERITLDNLLHLTLIASDNAAARALARLSHGGTAAFIERMNSKAVELGLEARPFTDPRASTREHLLVLRPLPLIPTPPPPTSAPAPSCERLIKVSTSGAPSIHNTIAS